MVTIRSHHPSERTNDDFSKMLTLQFRGPPSHHFRTRLTGLLPELKVIFTTTKAKSIFCLPKPKCHMKERYKVIYEYECPMCKKCYVGRTKRIFFHRQREHSSGPMGDHHITYGRSSEFNHSFEILC